MGKKRIQEYDEVPHKEESHTMHLIIGLIVLGALAAYWYYQPVPLKLHAQDLAVHGVHLGDDYQQVLKARGRGKTDQKMPGGMRNLMYSPTETYIFKADRVVFMGTAEAVQFPQFEIKGGDTRESMEKHLGVFEAGRSPQMGQMTWPGPDCRFVAYFGSDGKARSLSVYAP